MNEEAVEKLDRLNQEYYKRFWELKDNKTALSAEQYHKMEEILHKHYMREYELLDGETGIETDKQIERLKMQRDSELEAISLQHERQLSDIEREKEALRLERQKQLSEIRREEDALHMDLELAHDIAVQKNLLKREAVLPGELPKRWWQRHARPNRAKVLALQEVNIRVAEYFAEREDELEQLAGNAAETEELLSTLIPCPRGRRARRQWRQSIEAAAAELEHRLHHRVEAAAQLRAMIAAADAQNGGEVFDEHQDEEETVEEQTTAEEQTGGDNEQEDATAGQEQTPSQGGE